MLGKVVEVYTDPSAPSKPVDQLFRYLGAQVFAVIIAKRNIQVFIVQCNLIYTNVLFSLTLNLVYLLFSPLVSIFLMFLED